MAPLYFAMALGYGSVRWWKVFTADQCGAINRLVIYFAFPFFGFDLTARAGSFATSYRVLAADVACKALVVLALAGWAAARRWSSSCSYSWCTTGSSLVALNNALLMRIPLLDAMYGAWAHDIAVQMSMMQIVVWFPLMLVVFEATQAWLEMPLLVPADDGGGGGGGGGAAEEGGGGRPLRGRGSGWRRRSRVVGRRPEGDGGGRVAVVLGAGAEDGRAQARLQPERLREPSRSVRAWQYNEVSEHPRMT
jgi:auxin efflux carrier family